MKKFISAATSLAMAASLAASVVPAAANAADAKKTLTIAAYAQSDSAYANQGSSIKISEADITAGDVKVPCAVYLSEETNDTQTMAIPVTINSENADVKNVTFDLIDPNKDYFDTARDPYGVKNAVVFASEYDDLDGYTPTGMFNLTVDDHQTAAGAENYYIGYGQTFPRGYSWTGEKSDDYPVFVFDVNFPQGTAPGEYTIDFCDYIKDAQGNPALLLETDDRYSVANGNLETSSLTISIAGDEGSTNTTTSATETTTGTTTTQSHLEQDYDFYFDFGNYSANAGDKVTVDVLVQSDNNCPVASMDVKYKLDSPLTISAFGKKSAAYGDAATESNLDTLQQSFISLDTNGDPVAGTNGASVFKFVVDIPEDCPDGIYNIGFDNCEIYKNGQNSDMWTWYASNGLITVGDVEEDPDSTNPVTTVTTTSTLPDEIVAMSMGQYTAMPGDKVTVDVILSDCSVAVASMDIKYTIDSPLTISAFGKKSAAYGDAATESNLDTLQQSFISLDSQGDPVLGTVGESVFKFVVDIPEDCPDGEYWVSIADLEIFKSGQNSETWEYSVENAKIVVGDISNITTTTTTTVTTSSSTTATTTKDNPIAVDGDIVFDLGSYEATPGDTVTVDVILKSGEVAVASIDAQYKVDSPLTITTFGKKSAAYGDASVESNLDTYQQSFISLDTNGDPVIGTVGASVFKFVVTVPENCPNGTYAIKLDSCEVFKSGQNSDTWSWGAVNGVITVTGGEDVKYSGVGDLNKDGKVTAVDASLLLAFYADINAGTATVTDEDMYICDVNRDGKINATDASVILRYYADLQAGFSGSFVEYLAQELGVIIEE